MNRVQCPICDTPMPGSPVEYPDFPFCSQRCRVIDLGRWLSEDYKVASRESASEDRSTPGSRDED